MGQLARSYRELEVCQTGFKFQQEIFQVSKRWPAEERYALTGQIRRSSRSIGANMAEAWAKRRYPAHFLSKLTDSDGELQETKHWLDTANACEDISVDVHTNLCATADFIGRQLNRMMASYESFCLPSV
jgi:four helix bundle protein